MALTRYEIKRKLIKVDQAIADIAILATMHIDWGANKMLDGISRIADLVVLETENDIYTYNRAADDIQYAFEYLTGYYIQEIQSRQITARNIVQSIGNEILGEVDRLIEDSKLTITTAIKMLYDEVSEIVLKSQNSVIESLIGTAGYISDQFAEGYDNLRTGLQDLFSTIPKGVWDYLWTWLFETVPD